MVSRPNAYEDSVSGEYHATAFFSVIFICYRFFHWILREDEHSSWQMLLAVAQVRKSVAHTVDDLQAEAFDIVFKRFEMTTVVAEQQSVTGSTVVSKLTRRGRPADRSLPHQA